MRKVESEAAQRAREASRSGGSRSGDAFRAATRAATKSQDPAAAAVSPLARQRDTPTAQSARSTHPHLIHPHPPIRRRLGEPPAPPVPIQDEPPPPARERQSQGQPRRNPEPDRPPPPVPGFRDVTADADDLGRAAAQANRSARRTYANVPSQSPEFDRLEPSLEDRGGSRERTLPMDRPSAVPWTTNRRPCRVRGRSLVATDRSACPAAAFRSRARSPSASC